MKFKYIYALLTLVIALYFVPAAAQTTQKAKKTAAKPAAKKPAAAAKPKTKAASAKKTTANSLGEAVAKAAATMKVDTTKKPGQVDGSNNGSLSQEIVVTTAYKPVLADAVKIRRNPDLEDKTPFKAPLTYIPVDKRLELNSNIKQLDAMKRPAEQDSALYNNYVKLGGGNLKTTYGEAYFNNGRDEALQVGGYLKHFAQNGTLQKQNSDNGQAGVFIKAINTENTIRANVDYDYKSNYFYGYDQNNPPATLQLDKQHFNTIGAGLEVAKNFKDVENDFTYAIKVSGYIFNNAYQAKENNIVISGFVNQTVRQFYAGLSASLDLSTQKDSLYDQTNNIVRLNPYIKFQGDNYKIDAGVNIVGQSGFSTAFYVFPAAKLEYQVIPKYVRLFVEAKGDINRSSLRDFAMANPFIGQNTEIRNSVDFLDVAAGLKGVIAPGLGFKATFFRNDIKNMPLFISDFNFAAGYNRYKVIYDGGRSIVSGLNGELDYKISDDVDIFGRVEFKNYKMASEQEAWNLPKFKFVGGTNFRINDKVTVSGTLLLRGSAFDPYQTTTTTGTGTTTTAFTQIGSFADVSGAVDYKINRHFNVFVHVNNILNGTNQSYLYYPDYGFNIFGGAGYSF